MNQFLVLIGPMSFDHMVVPRVRHGMLNLARLSASTEALSANVVHSGSIMSGDGGLERSEES
jgi:hypothetical protein